MLQEFDPTDHVYLSKDARGNVRELLHLQKPFTPKSQLPLLVTREYLESFGRYYKIPNEHLKNLEMAPEKDLTDDKVEYRFLETKELFDTVTVGVQQTYFGLPVWRAGLSVTMKQEPPRVITSQSTADTDIQVKKPRAADLKRVMSLDAKDLYALLVSSSEKEATGKSTAPLRIVASRLIIYRYDGARRVTDEGSEQTEPAPGKLPVVTDRKPLTNVRSANIERKIVNIVNQHERHPALPLPPVPDSIEDDKYYVCREITFVLDMPAWGELTWVAIIETETLSVLYLRALSDNVDGMVFVADPATSGSVATPAANNATLNPLRTTITLPNLSAPSGGNQSLTGSIIQISDFEQATVAPPTEPVGTNFNYNARTNNFAAVNAYYHCDRFFRLVQELGFTLATYFDGTTFPLPVDHRGRFGSVNGVEMNASCSGNGTGGIANVDFELADLTDTTNPMGIAADWRVVLHELGGHGILYDHVNTANFGFAHSAGDSFAAILNDPDTQAPDRFVTFPWVNIGRRHDRSVGSGWGWGGASDLGGYNSEQILCTTNFRIYRSIGGDSTDVNMRRFASRFVAYLLLRAIGTLTPATNPGNAIGLANALITADQGDWTSEGHSGGAYGKVIRWAFEKQGLYQPAGAPTPVTTVGAPPAVDVYIDDGRGGEYQHQPNHWSCQAIWNRRNNDSGTGHEEPYVGLTNYAYVKIKNRGTQTATNVIVKGFHCKPSSGLVWPNDWQPMTTAQLSSPNVAPNSTSEITVGPFEWVPTELGHECMLMIVSASGDPSNIDNFTAGDSIPEWRLVPHDNNIGQRNVAPVPGGSLRGLMLALTRRKFWVNNPHLKKARIKLSVKMPALLEKLGWDMSFESAGGTAFSLAPGQSKEVIMTAKVGKEFSPEQIANLSEEERTIHVETYADGILVGGMSYQLDHRLKMPLPQRGDLLHKPGTGMEELLECLKLKGDEIKSVKVRRVTIDVNFKDDCC